MYLIVPMAGLGQRYKDEGFALPKPLIPVGGVPMVVRAVNDLPAASEIVFLVHPQHVAEHQIDRVLRRHFPKAHVVVTPGLTAGQACTVRLAEAVLPRDADVLVAACDNSHVYSEEKFHALQHDPSLEGIVWTYRRDPRVLTKPTSYGWVKMTKSARGTPLVRQISCKVPISEEPLNDHVVSGFFWFRSSRELFATIDELVASNRRINNEFYLDVVPNLYLDRGQQFAAFEVEKYIGWGTPADLRDYEAWQSYFLHQRGKQHAA